MKNVRIAAVLIAAVTAVMPFALNFPEIPSSAVYAGETANVVSEQTDLKAGQFRVAFVDYDTGEFIAPETGKQFMISTDIAVDIGGQMAYTGPIMIAETSPAIVDDNLAGFFQTAHSFSFAYDGSGMPKNYSLPGGAERMIYSNGTVEPEGSIKVTRYDNGAADVVFRLKYTPSGDVSGDGSFGVNDAVLLQKWLTGVPGTELADWRAADFCHDGLLNTFDLVEMIKKLSDGMNRLVEPEEEVEYGPDLVVVADEITMYSGPDYSYPVVTTIPGRTILCERGFSSYNDKWIFTDYEGNYGWVRLYTPDDKERTVDYMAVPAKPVIYLYPQQETDVRVELELNGADLRTTYPRYNEGWNVTAYPDGTLVNKADGSRHRYFFWDAENCSTIFDFSKGFCVAGGDTEAFLKEKLTLMGLTEDEMNEFIVYWLPLMEHNAYNLISFQGEKYTDTAKLTITPEPDSELRIFMTYVPLDEPVKIEPQEFEPFERKGFTVVEWGGCNIKAN